MRKRPTEFQKRSFRFIRHVFMPWQDDYLSAFLRLKKWGLFLMHWLLEIPLVALDMIGLPEWFAFFQARLKPTSRRLSDAELNLAHSIFGDSFDLLKARIDENSTVGTHGGKYAFVSYYYINCKGRLSLPILIHELVHIFQFSRDGSPYAIRNLVAHLTPPTYDYGGLDTIQKICADPFKIHWLNYEQRADIFSDYCLMMMGQRPEWGSAEATDLKYYKQVIDIILKA